MNAITLGVKKGKMARNFDVSTCTLSGNGDALRSLFQTVFV